MKLCYAPDTPSAIVHVFIEDSTVTTGAGKTGLAYGSITAYYVRSGGVLTQLTPETIAVLGTWASGGNNKLGFLEVDSTNEPGLYELDLPNNILATGAKQVVIQIRATGAKPTILEIQLDPLPSDMFKVEGIDVTSSTIEANVTEWEGVAVATPDTAGCPSVTIQAGTGVGEISNIIEAMLKYNFLGITGEASRSMLNALRRLVNKVAVAGSTLTVYKENDSTAALTQALITSTSASLGAIESADTV